MIDAVAAPRTIHLTLDEAGLLQGCEVLRYGGCGEVDLAGELPGDAFVSSEKRADDADACGVAQCPSELCELCLSLRTARVDAGGGIGWTCGFSGFALDHVSYFY